MKMLPQNKISQADELRRRLPSHGWEVTEIERPFEDEWWVAEFWIIESAWSPQGVQVYLTFLVDPMGGLDDIWVVYASKERPRQQPLDANPLMSLGHGWQKELSVFIGNLHRFRADHHMNEK
jgi:hypothetical protein